MRTHRIERLNKLILEELNTIIIRELEFEGALVTLTYIDISKDLDKAVVGVSAIPSEKSEEAVKKLQKSSKRLEYLLLKKLNMRRVPELTFIHDIGLEKAAGIERKLME